MWDIPKGNRKEDLGRSVKFILPRCFLSSPCMNVIPFQLRSKLSKFYVEKKQAEGCKKKKEVYIRIPGSQWFNRYGLLAFFFQSFQCTRHCAKVLCLLFLFCFLQPPYMVLLGHPSYKWGSQGSVGDPRIQTRPVNSAVCFSISITWLCFCKFQKFLISSLNVVSFENFITTSTLKH